MSDDWEAIGYVISSRYRVAVLRRLAESPATPSQIAKDADLAITHISRSLSELREKSVVELLVPEERTKGRVYGVTDKGERIWQEIQSQNLV